jgi:hypothetical protein
VIQAAEAAHGKDVYADDDQTEHAGAHDDAFANGDFVHVGVLFGRFFGELFCAAGMFRHLTRRGIRNEAHAAMAVFHSRTLIVHKYGDELALRFFGKTFPAA